MQMKPIFQFKWIESLSNLAVWNFELYMNVYDAMKSSYSQNNGKIKM